jgi:tetratricopeptide (TPR) repeat protein
MNSKPQRPAPARVKPAATFSLRGRSYSLAEALPLAAGEQSLGNFQTAVEVYDFILTHIPQEAVVHNNRGVLLQKIKRYDEALAAYDRAISFKPDYANAHFNRGTLLKLLRRSDEALAAFDRAIALKPDHGEAHNSRAVILQDLKHFAEAVASYDRAIAAKPNYAEALNNRGTVMVSRGDMPEAEKMFRKAFELKPDFADPLYNLANIRKYPSVDHPDVKNIRALLDRPDAASADKESLYFTLGKIYDECDHYEEAFEFYRRANELRDAQVAYNPAAVTKMTDDLIAVFSKDFLAGPFAYGSDNPAPLFIVGMPRSGTTLLASILSNHPAISTAGELTTLTDLAAGLSGVVGKGISYPEAARHLNPSLAGRLVREYETRLRRDAASSVSYVIDKYPLNFRHLGLIASLFPKAHILHCTRHPLDAGLSNYFQRFPLFLDYCFDLRNIGHFYNEYVRLMEHWHKIPTLKLMDVSYEDMISNTEQVVRRALNFLGLEWDERCLSPHTNPCAVESASQWQVRQPIYRHSLERWRHYEKQLAPLIEMLAPIYPPGAAPK